MRKIHKLIVRHTKKIFDIHVELLSIVNRFNLTKSEKLVLSELLNQYHVYKDIPEDEKAAIIFSSAIRKKIITELSIDVNTFNNILSKFRTREGKYGYIIIGKSVNPAYLISPENANTFVIQIDKYDTANDTK